MSKNRLMKLRRDIEAEKVEKAKLEERKKMLLDNLKSSHKCKSVKKAEIRLGELRADREAICEEIEELNDKLEKGLDSYE